MNKNEITQQIHDIASEFSAPSFSVPYIAILQPRRTFRETPAQQLENHVERMIDLTSMSVSFHAIDGNPVDVAYNYLIEKAIDDNAKYAITIEEDVVVPWDGVKRLLKTSQDYPDAIIVGVYYIKFGDVMISLRDSDNRWFPIDPTPNTVIRRNIQSCGLGCTLIPIHVIHKIKAEFPDLPLFCVVPEGCWSDPEIKDIGVDTWFYHLAAKCGVEIICDTHVQCLHVELATGKYTAHPDVNLDDYVTNMPISSPLTLRDRERVSMDYIRRIQAPEWAKNNIKEET